MNKYVLVAVLLSGHMAKVFDMKNRKNVKDDYVKKLEKRIHNQRIQLRMNWQILEERMLGRSQYVKPKWFEKVIVQIGIIKHLEEKIKTLSNGQRN